MQVLENRSKNVPLKKTGERKDRESYKGGQKPLYRTPFFSTW